MPYFDTPELPQLSEETRRLIQASQIAPGNTATPAENESLWGMFSGSPGANIPPEAANVLSPEQIKQVQKPGSKSLQIMKVLALAGALLTGAPLAGALAYFGINKAQKGESSAKQQLVNQALKLQQQRTENEIAGTTAGAHKTSAEAAMKQAGATEADLPNRQTSAAADMIRALAEQKRAGSIAVPAEKNRTLEDDFIATLDSVRPTISAKTRMDLLQKFRESGVLGSPVVSGPISGLLGNTPAPAASVTPSGMPDAASNAGRTIRDTATGARYKSDGKQWVKQ